MIQWNGAEFRASWTGLFVTDQPWIHPKRIEETYELIYMVSGEAYIQERQSQYVLKEGDVLLLDAHALHFGYQISSGKTSFFYAHFYISDPQCLPQLHKLVHSFSQGFRFKEHLSLFFRPGRSQDALDISMINLVSRFLQETAVTPGRKLAKDIFEWVKIQASPGLSLDDVSAQFGYTGAHISRVLKQSYNMTFVRLLNDMLIRKAKYLLSSTNYSIKEIAEAMSFDSDNLFTKFYKYHTGNTPTAYREANSNIRINSK